MDNNHQPKVSTVRIVEAIIIAAISSVVLSVASFFIIVPVMRSDFETFKASQTAFNAEIKDELKGLRKEYGSKLEGIDTKLWNLKGSNSR